MNPGPPSDTTLELISLIYDAVADSSRWSIVLESIILALGGRLGALTIRDAADPVFAVVCYYGLTADDIHVYGRYAASDPWAIPSARLPQGFVGTDPELCPREEMESSVAFREFYVPRGAFHGMGAVILRTNTGQSVISICRGAKDGPFGETEKAILRPLMPHLARAATLHGEFGAMRRQLALFTDHLNRYSHPFFLTDSRARLLFANSAARAIFSSNDGITLENGLVAMTSPRAEATFREAVSEVSALRGSPLRRLSISRPSQKSPYRLILMPAEHMRDIPLGVSLPAVSILVLDPDSRPEPDAAFLSEIFSLTPAEARVAGKLALGQSVDEIASESKVTSETIRTHVKRILSKTGTDRQGELISLILRSAPVRKA